ncbi:MAG: prepilin-type N-terminal cleavage/methylation domain-containing protein [Patescibacteria group bacterium]
MESRPNAGFSLLELTLVVGILGIIGSIGFGFYYNFVRQAEIDLTATNIVFDLKQAQAKSMSGDSGRKWGVYFMNGASDYYEFFSTPTDYDDPAKEIKATVYLPGNLFFTQPAASSTVLFNKISGGTGSTTISISSLTGQVKTINITSIGNIY